MYIYTKTKRTLFAIFCNSRFTTVTHSVSEIAKIAKNSKNSKNIP